MTSSTELAICPRPAYYKLYDELITEAVNVQTPAERSAWYYRYILVIHIVQLWHKYQNNAPSEPGIWIIYVTGKQAKAIERFPIAECHDPANAGNDILEDKYSKLLSVMSPSPRSFYGMTEIEKDRSVYVRLRLYPFFLDNKHNFMLACFHRDEKRVLSKIAFPMNQESLFGSRVPPAMPQAPRDSSMSSTAKESLAKNANSCIACGNETHVACVHCKVFLYCSHACKQASFRKHFRQCSKFRK